MPKDLAIILNNGGLNAAVATALAAQKHRPVLLFGEAAADAGAGRRTAYEMQVAHFKPYREHTAAWEMGLPALEDQGQDAYLLQSVDPRHAAPLGPRMLELLPLVAAAARFAGHYEAAAVYLGMRVGPGGDVLAEATEFVQIWNELVQLPCGRSELEVVAPLLELEPWQVVDLGFQVGAPFELTWSCTEQMAEPCWSCRGCRAREAAFMQAGKPDPLRSVRRV